MIVGILSDTHDQVAAMRLAIQTLRDAGADLFVHCGDVGGALVLDQLAGLNAAFVWGNNDWDRATLSRYAETIGITCLGKSGEVHADTKRIAVAHGDDLSIIRSIIDAQRVDYLLLGHTHKPLDTQAGKVRMINPGALYRAKEKTVALLDTTADTLQFITLEI